ncbi:hypothetical protein DYB30_004274 [Aphanomyces astaci]|uniref:RING-type E3 ubiquitin transferase n=1 Tax=Aphanomyces astaci TaxID=112090 RepID=A0A397DV34_APHAT|nr:hypothetical protein DYB30_004274 [Aphanomyces astaci]
MFLISTRHFVGIVRNATVIKSCLHRFCDKCLNECLRSGIKECPSCRAVIGPKRSSLRRDETFDKLVATIYPDLERYEAAEDERIASANTPKRLHHDGNPMSPSGKRAKATAQVGASVKILHSELEKQSRALEESQEETQLAARIGQSLLLQKQQLDYEMEDKVSAVGY